MFTIFCYFFDKIHLPVQICVNRAAIVYIVYMDHVDHLHLVIYGVGCVCLDMSSYKKVNTFIDFLIIQPTRLKCCFLSISIFYLVDAVIRRVEVRDHY